MTRRNGYLALSSAIALSVSVGSLGFPSGDSSNQLAMLNSDCSGLKLTTADRSINKKIGEPINFNVTGASCDNCYSMLAPDPTLFGMQFASDGSFSWDTTGRKAGEYEVTIEGKNGSACGRLSVNLRLDSNSTNKAPSLANPGSAKLKVGESRTVTLKARDKEGESLSYDISGDLDIQRSETKANEFTITAMPGNETGGNGKGLFTLIASASDGHEGNVTEKAFKIKVTPNSPKKEKNKAPRFVNLKNQTASIGQLLDYNVTATDDGLPSGSTVSYSVLRSPDGESATFEGSHFRYTPSSAGNKIFQIGASDGSKTGKKMIRVNVLASGHRPRILTIGGVEPVGGEVSLDSIATGEELAFTVDAEDDDGNIKTYKLDGAPSGAKFDDATGAFSWTAERSRRINMHLTVIDDTGLKSDRIAITSEVVNDADPTPPTKPAPRFRVTGLRSNYTIDQDTVHLKVEFLNPQYYAGCNAYFGVYHRPQDGSKPYSVYGSDYTAGWLFLDKDKDIEFDWNVSASRYTRAIFPGRYVAQMGYECSDEDGFTPMQNKDIEIFLVAPSNDPDPTPTSNSAPVFQPLERGMDSTPKVSAANGVVLYRHSIAKDKEDGEITNYYADGVLTSGCQDNSPTSICQSYDPATRTFTWDPKPGNVGTFTVKFYAKDSGGKTDMRKLTITVVP